MPVIDLLYDRGLIERTSNPSDRRRAIALTAAGQVVLSELRRAADAIEHDMLEALDERDRATLHRLLGQLFEATIGR